MTIGASPPECRIALGAVDDDDLQVRELLTPDGPFPEVAGINLSRALVRHPSLYRKFVPFGMKVLNGGRLPSRNRELCILRTAYRCGSEYEWIHHTAIGRVIGLTDLEISDVRAVRSNETGSDHDRTLIGAVDELHDNDEISDQTWRALSQRYSDQQLIELVVLVGTYQLVAGVLRSLRVPIEPAVEGNVPVPEARETTGSTAENEANGRRGRIQRSTGDSNYPDDSSTGLG
jgi:4-carboxymuconolactone decarboxylase